MKCIAPPLNCMSGNGLFQVLIVIKSENVNLCKSLLYDTGFCVHMQACNRYTTTQFSPIIIAFFKLNFVCPPCLNKWPHCLPTPIKLCNKAWRLKRDQCAQFCPFHTTLPFHPKCNNFKNRNVRDWQQQPLSVHNLLREGSWTMHCYLMPDSQSLFSGMGK